MMELTKEYPINYHIIHIDDTRIANRKNVDKVLKGNKVSIKCLNGTVHKEIISFKLENPEFKFGYNAFKLGELGNFASHYLSWKYLIQSDLNELIIFEDDVLIDDTFNYKYQKAMNELPEDYDVFSIYVNSNEHFRFDESQRISYYISKAYQHMYGLCYVVSKKGAEKMYKYVKEIGFDDPVDWFIFKKGRKNIFNVYTLAPNIKNPLAIDSKHKSQVQETRWGGGYASTSI